MLTSTFRKYFQNQYVAGLSAALALMVNGACFVWVTPILHLLDKEKFKDVLIPMTPTEISWLLSIIELGSLCSPIISGVLSDYCGRKISILLAGPFILAGWIIILTTRDVTCLYVVRVLQGFGMGNSFTTVPIYLGEIAEPKVRGVLTSLLQTMWYTGILFQYIIGSYLSYDNSVIVNIVLSSVVFVFFFITQQESPYYLTMKKNDQKAIKSLMLLRGKSSVSEVEEEMQNIRDCIEKDMKKKVKWSDAFKLTRTDFKILLIVQFLAIFRVGSGTVAIGSYISELLHMAEWEYLSVKTTMVIYGILTIFFIVIAMFFIDFVGRRPLLILSCIGTGICTFSIGCSFLFESKDSSVNSSSIRWLCAPGLICYTILFALGLGPVTQTIQSELFPTNIRALGNIVTSYNLTISSFFILRFYQVIIDLFGVYTNFFIFSTVSFVGAIFIYIYVPETKGKTFLEISGFFEDKKEPDTKSNTYL